MRKVNFAHIPLLLLRPLVELPVRGIGNHLGLQMENSYVASGFEGVLIDDAPWVSDAVESDAAAGVRIWLGATGELLIVRLWTRVLIETGLEIRHLQYLTPVTPDEFDRAKSVVKRLVRKLERNAGDRRKHLQPLRGDPPPRLPRLRDRR